MRKLEKQPEPAASGIQKRCRLYRNAFVAVARTLSAACVNSTSDLASYFNVSSQSISNWKREYPEFKHAIETGNLQMVHDMTALAVELAHGGSEPMVRYLLDRRAPAFKPSTKIEHGVEQNTLENMIERRINMGLTEEERRAIFPDGGPGDDYEPSRQLAAHRPDTSGRPPASRMSTEQERLIYGDDAEGDDDYAPSPSHRRAEPEPRRPQLDADPKRPYNFKANRYD